MDATLQTTLAPLWTAIVNDSVDPALGVFFPQTAYVQMKTGVLPYPASDYADRLIAFYRLDIPAYHQALGPAASTAKLLSVSASAADAAYIPPGHARTRSATGTCPVHVSSTKSAEPCSPSAWRR